MPNINIPIADELHKEIKIAALLEDKTLKEYILETLEQEVGE